MTLSCIAQVLSAQGRQHHRSVHGPGRRLRRWRQGRGRRFQQPGSHPQQLACRRDRGADSAAGRDEGAARRGAAAPRHS